MAEKREHSTHVRLCYASDAMLSFLAESKGSRSKKNRDLIEAMKKAAERFLRTGTSGMDRE